jgi:uncharacterized protein DUF1549/uncharacterized protein DUF1553
MLRRTWHWLAFVTLSACSGSCSGTPAPIPPTAPLASAAPATATDVVARADALLEAEWKTAGVSPAKPATDAQFLRRVYLDLSGTLPSPEAVTAFLADAAPDKRARVIDALLASPRFTERWAAYWEDVLIRPRAKANIIDRAAFGAWLRARFHENAPWDRVVREIVSARGVSSPGGEARERRAAAATGAAETEVKGVNGAVNWLLQFNRSTEDAAGAASRLFLGVQIQCAQCHDHKTERWTTQDFRHFAAAFARTRVRPVDEKEKGMMRTFEVSDGEKARPGPKASAEQREIAQMTPAALDGTELTGSAPRAELAGWITAQTNPWFAKAIVNRMWALLLGHGFVEPIDDLRPSNTPAAGAVLDALSADFAAHGHDLKRLLRTICSTRAYSLAAGTPEAEAAWAAFQPRALPAPLLFEAILAATKIEPVLEEALGERADALRTQMRQRFRFVFDVDESGESDDFEGTIPQALLLMNGPFVGYGSTAIAGTTLADVLAMPGGDAAKIESLYLRALSRRPTTEETSRFTRFLDEASAAPADSADAPPGSGPIARLGKKKRLVARTSRDRAYEDLFWALLNSSEFAFQH